MYAFFLIECLLASFSSKSIIASAIASESLNGTIIPLFSASNSLACQYGVEITAFPQPKEYDKVPEVICALFRYRVS